MVWKGSAPRTAASCSQAWRRQVSLRFTLWCWHLNPVLEWWFCWACVVQTWMAGQFLLSVAERRQTRTVLVAIGFWREATDFLIVDELLPLLWCSAGRGLVKCSDVQSLLRWEYWSKFGLLVQGFVEAEFWPLTSSYDGREEVTGFISSSFSSFFSFWICLFALLNTLRRLSNSRLRIAIPHRQSHMPHLLPRFSVI